MNDLALYELGLAMPVCAVCNKPVDKVESMYLPDYDGKVFRVYCHGKVEQQMLGSYDVMNAKQITFGKAFDAPKLERAMTDRELMQQALDALEGYARNCKCEGGGAPCDAAESLRARLAQPEPEPVAWFMEGTFEDGTPSFTQVCESDPEFYVPLYTAPPQREWQGLTDEEVIKLGRLDKDSDYFGLWYDFARAIEQALKEKNT